MYQFSSKPAKEFKKYIKSLIIPLKSIDNSGIL